MLFVGMIICTLFLVAVWKVRVTDEINDEASK